MDSVNEIKSRLAIEDLVAQYVPLKRVGRSFKALCPFHKEKTPSFHVSPERQLAYCFGCHKGGDHFKFIQEIEGVDFKGALQLLAEKTGVTLPKMLPRDTVKASERERLFDLHEEAASFFERHLHSSEGNAARDYLKKRGFAESAVRAARVGYTPKGSDALYSYLLGKDFTRDEIMKSGLAIGRDIERGTCVDRFRNRLMFPIKNLTGAVAAFGGRALEPGDEPKYLNSPETPIYHKSSFLYGLSDARPAIREEGTAVIVEGYMDAIAAHQAGYKNVVACSGTALTEEQLALLKRFTKNMIFALDRDDAGKLATLRAIEIALPFELSLRIAAWDSPAKDPDECLQKDPVAFKEALENAPPYLEYLVAYFGETIDLKNAAGKKKFVDELLPYIAKTKSPIELDESLKYIATKAGISTSSLYDELKRFQGMQRKPPQIRMRSVSQADSDQAPQGSSPNEYRSQEYLLGLLLTYCDFRSVVNQFLVPEDFEEIELQNIYRCLTTQYNQRLEDTDAETRERADILALLIESKTGEMDARTAGQEISSALHSFLKQIFEREKRSLVTQLKAADGKEKTKLLDRMHTLLAREASVMTEIARPSLWQKN